MKVFCSITNQSYINFILYYLKYTVISPLGEDYVRRCLLRGAKCL
jgi:hypothetical protein